MSEYGYIRDNYFRLTEELRALGERYGRDITLVAVTKSGTDGELLELASLGVGAIGENRPQELKRRGELLYSHGYTPSLHEIGHLQPKNVRQIIDKVSLIHSLDSLRLAEEISKRSLAIGRVTPVLIEINSAREESKSGVMPEDCLELLYRVRELPSISVMGLMTMGPVSADSEDIRPYFRLVKGIFDKIKDERGFVGDGILSMGMSDSYRIAIEEGATMVRVGSLLFKK